MPRANRYYISLINNQIGSLKAVTDSSGNVVKKIDYDSFGNIISDTNPSLRISFGFTGGLHDRDTKLVCFGARDYDPTLGRWTAKDPIDFAGGDTNLYGYVADDPVNRVDSNGLKKCEPWAYLGCWIACEAACHALIGTFGPPAWALCFASCHLACESVKKSCGCE